MPKLINVILALSLLFAVSCNQASNHKADSVNHIKDSNAKIEMIYFHTTIRCVTCKAAEDLTKSILEEKFKYQLENGDITFKSLNVEEAENESIAEKYQVTFSTLLLINHQKGKEEVNDLTEEAFKYSSEEPEKYKELLIGEINKILKS